MGRGYGSGMSQKDYEEMWAKETDSDSEEVKDVLKLPLSENPTYFVVPELKGLVKKRPRESTASLRVSREVWFINK